MEEQVTTCIVGCWISNKRTLLGHHKVIIGILFLHIHVSCLGGGCGTGIKVTSPYCRRESGNFKI